MVYLVRSFWGAYSDAGESIEAAFARRASAVEWVKSQTCAVYEDSGEVYAAYGCEEGIYEIHPTRHGYRWQFDCHANLDTPTYEILGMGVVE